MCRAEEELMEEVKEHAGRIRALQNAYNLLILGKLSNEDIASALELPLEEVEALAEKVKLDKEQQSASI